ncbi:Helicase required for RNAi-mediated heterochromatin assembly 1 [Cytospora mali]|uniref:Helicase required for RNAi-mediated heterochromatin assembly 1 n=1 Tax=Cytospora mali TaxID=578113 RepID=A0A194W1C4_CYTMA|nr:Helicase required for RNAi-mediated heterochromatin assembly 1 [Valsa mali]
MNSSLLAQHLLHVAAMPPNIGTDTDAVAIIRSHVNFDPLKSTTPESSSSSSVWQCLPELPTAAELLDSQASTNNLPFFPIDQPFHSKDEYLEALYKILRFEGIEGLRYSVNDFRSRPTMADDQNTCVYTKVHTTGYLMARLGPICRVTFSTRRAGRKIKWNQSKRLLPGKILALSADNFNKDCRVAIVAQRPIEGGLDQIPPSIDIFWADVEQAVVDPDQELVMIESRNGFYEAVRHALTGLQQASGNSAFDKYLVSLDNGDNPAKFISEAPNLDLTSLITKLTPAQLEQAAGNKHTEQLIFEKIMDQYRECNIMRQLPHSGIGLQTSLDSSQLEALQRMLSKELAIVQGPPGTGKTFTSVQAIRAMLDNRRPGDPPIIIAAQTNHALDQLLIYCQSAGARIMRVGGRTENEVIEERTVYNLRNSAGKMPTDGQYRSLEKGRIRIVERFTNLVSGVFGGQGLIDAEALLQAGIITEAQFESLTDEEWEGTEDVPPMQMWLGDEQIQRIRQQGDDMDFAEEEPIDEELDPDLEDEAVGDDEDRLRGTWVPLTSHYTGRTPRVTGWKSRCIARLDSCDDLYDIPTSLRGGVYQLLQSKLRDVVGDKFRAVLGEAVSQAKEQKVNKWSRDLYVIEKHCIDVIGCTTTGLSKYRGFLAATKARILLIEEAAETREANVTSALCTFPTLQQLVLVGDHQQLPPQCDISRLGDAPFHLNTSLFERLVHNEVPYTMLNRQRRMAPELRFIVQQYYPKLLDHPIVKDVANRPLVPGMGDRRSWFFAHRWPEETDADSSKYNTQEAQMVVAFMRYLVQNGVEASQITVLTYYRGQRKKILQLLRRDVLLMKTSYFNVATVDSYQGEENEVVLLSLVRSPQPHDIPRVGFLDSKNRATVAVSRARRGFFLFGNHDNLLSASDESYDVWAPIWNGLAIQKRIAMSKGLPLICQNHEEEIWMKTPEDFQGNAGGCWIKCRSAMICFHACALAQGLSLVVISVLESVLTSALGELQPYGNVGQGQATESSSGRVSQSGLTTDNSSPEKWQQFSRDPRSHDDAIRQARLQQMAEQEAQDQSPMFLGNPANTIEEASGSKAPDAIQESFIPIQDQGGRRIPGEARIIDSVSGGAQHNQQRNKHGPKGGRQSASQKHRRAANNVTSQQQQRAQQAQRQLSGRFASPEHSAIAQASGRSLQHDYVANQFSPVVRQARHIAESTVGDSDVGFEAEVLGIRRSHTTQIDTSALREQFQHQPPPVHGAVPLISFDDLGGAEARAETSAEKQNIPSGKEKDDEPELLIDI